MDIIQCKISKIKPYDKNPRINNKAVNGVVKSIKEFGFQQPIVVDKDMVIIVGHTRLKAAIKLNLKEVPVLIANNLTRAQVKAYRIADNKSGEKSEWNKDFLFDEIIDLSELEFNLDNTCFDHIEINKLLENKPPPEINESMEDKYMVVIYCEDEQDQTNTLIDLNERGIKCRALIS